jgi:putative transposase
MNNPLLYTDPSGYNWFKKVFKFAIVAIGASHGKPKALRTDNEAVFNSRLFKSGLAALVNAHQTAHQTTPLASPWQNARIERLFGTLKQSLDQLSVSSEKSLQNMMGEFKYFYKPILPMTRPHQNLGGLTPAQAWAGLSWADLLQTMPKSQTPYSAWGGLLTGWHIRL